MKKYLIIVAVTLQCLALLYICIEREIVFQKGKTVFIKTIPVDPRDIFRGDYVTLRYPISSIDKKLAIQKELKELEKPERRVYLSYSLDEENLLKPEKLSLNKPQNGNFIRGLTRKNWRNYNKLGIQYSIEKFFVQQGSGFALETGKFLEKVRIPLEMEVNIGRKNGIAVIKGYRYAKVGMGIIFPDNRKKKIKSYIIKIRVANASNKDIAIIDDTQHSTFKLVMDIRNRSKEQNTLKFENNFVENNEFQISNLIIIKPQSIYEFTIDLTKPCYQLLRKQQRISWGDLDWGEQFTIQYTSPKGSEIDKLSRSELLVKTTINSSSFDEFNFD